jgi:hypothetical protein
VTGAGVDAKFLRLCPSFFADRISSMIDNDDDSRAVVTFAQTILAASLAIRWDASSASLAATSALATPAFAAAFVDVEVGGRPLLRIFSLSRPESADEGGKKRLDPEVVCRSRRAAELPAGSSSSSRSSIT